MDLKIRYLDNCEDCFYDMKTPGAKKEL